MTRLTLFTSALAIVGFIGVVQYPTVLEAAAPRASQQDHEAHHPLGSPPPVSQAQEAGMVDMHQRMMAEMVAVDSKLDALVAKMNAATGEAKLQAIAELLTAIVEERTAMRSGMMQMQGQTGQTMQHMSQGMSPEMQKMMAECPMMKQMGGAR
jgi:hypothetical protein